MWTYSCMTQWRDGRFRTRQVAGIFFLGDWLHVQTCWSRNYPLATWHGACLGAVANVSLCLLFPTNQLLYGIRTNHDVRFGSYHSGESCRAGTQIRCTWLLLDRLFSRSIHFCTSSDLTSQAENAYSAVWLSLSMALLSLHNCVGCLSLHTDWYHRLSLGRCLENFPWDWRACAWSCNSYTNPFPRSRAVGIPLDSAFP